MKHPIPSNNLSARLLAAFSAFGLLASAPFALAEELTWTGAKYITDVLTIGEGQSISVEYASGSSSTPDVWVGRSGESGTLNVNGGSLQIETGGAGVGLLVGYSSTGTVNMTDGSISWLGSGYGQLWVGMYAGSSGTVNQSGGSIALPKGSLYLGFSGGTGTLTLSGDAQHITGQTAHIGWGTGAVGLIDIKDNATFSMTTGDVGMHLGRAGGTGTFKQSDNAIVNFNHSARVRVGSEAGASAPTK